MACFAALAVLALAPAAHPQPPGSAAVGRGPLAKLRAGVPGAGWAAAVASAAALVVLGVSAVQAGGPPPAAAGSLKTANIAGVTVLTNAKGFTLNGHSAATREGSGKTIAGSAHRPMSGPGIMRSRTR